MHHFHYVGGKLFCEKISVESLAKKFGTPLYIHSQCTLTDRFLQLDEQLALPLGAGTRPGRVDRDNLSHFRKGAVGEWIDFYTTETHDWFNEEAEPVLSLSGYGRGKSDSATHGG